MGEEEFRVRVGPLVMTFSNLLELSSRASRVQGVRSHAVCMYVRFACTCVRQRAIFLSRKRALLCGERMPIERLRKGHWRAEHPRRQMQSARTVELFVPQVTRHACTSVFSPWICCKVVVPFACASLPYFQSTWIFI